jgi:hypothetical protein
MDRTIICNWGSSGQGKSASIRRTYELLMQAFPSAEEQVLESIGDISVIVTIGNIRIGIESQGDPDSRLTRERLGPFVPHCDIILCAARSRGQTVWIVNDVATNNDYRLIWVNNHRSSDTQSPINTDLNNLSAQSFLTLITQIMSGL